MCKQMNKIAEDNSPNPAVFYLTVDKDYAGQRLDNFLITRLKGLPKSRLYRIMRKGEVRVNKKRITPEYRIQAGDVIRIPPVRLAATVVTKASDNAMQLLETAILYEDKGLIVINKPAGMAVHGGSGISLGLIETIRQLRPYEKSLELVHRLDRDTSGCLLLAKKPSILKQLHELIRNDGIQKIYTALAQGDWPRGVKMVDAPLYKNQLSSGERIVRVNSQGKASLTSFRVLQRFNVATLMEARPHTGRTHQIRVHAAHVGHPLVADDKYGDKEFNRQMKQQGCKRLFLHASRLIFELAESGQKINVEAPLPADLQRCLESL